MIGAEQQTGKQPLRPRVIAITSGKGGVGKSSIAVNLGLSLVKGGSRVCILDADTGLANVNILLGINPELRLDHVLFGARSIEEVVVDGPLGMKVIPGASGISECVSLHPRQQLRLTRELARIESQFDYLLVDTAAGIADTTLDFISAAHQTLLVITPEPTSLTDAFSLVKLMARRDRQLTFLVVVNMCSGLAEARQVFSRFSAAVTKYIGLQVQMLGCVQRDESLRSAVTLQNPVALYPDSDPSSRSFLRLAESLHDRLEKAALPASFADYWQQHYRQAAAAGDAAAERLDDNGERRADRPADATGHQRWRSRSEHVARPPVDGEAAPERTLDAWQQQWRELINGDNLPREVLAGSLVGCHELFWQRFGQPALALPALVSRLADEPERHAALLQAVRSALPTGDQTIDPATGCQPEPEPALVLARSTVPDAAPVQPPPEPCAVEIAAAEDAEASPPTLPVPTPAPVSPPMPSLFGHIAEAEVESAATPVRSVIHGYDENRFGSQARLADLLQRQAASGKSVIELIHALV